MKRRFFAFILFSHATFFCLITHAQQDSNRFNGNIQLDIRDSKADWNAFLYKQAPKGAPNVLFILYDDTGQATWSPYGGAVNMPTLDRLAKNGLIYTQWHTTSVCSPTRSTMLTGRNHHANGFGSISESAVGFPGYSGHIPDDNATIATILRNAGWATFWIGKNHNVPVDAFGMGASKKNWPLGLGFDRFYGFIGGETNQWYPALIEDNHFVDQPYQPEQGYHLSKDLADKAIQYIRDSKQSDPNKPCICGTVPAPTMHRIMRPLNTLQSIKANSMRDMKHTGNGY